MDTPQGSEDAVCRQRSAVTRQCPAKGFRSRLCVYALSAPLREIFPPALFILILTNLASAQTIYTTVLGNQSYVVGSSTLRSGLFVSRDSAKTWRHVGPENLKAYSMDAVDTSNGRILYIAAGNGVHRSTDYGNTWKIVTDWRVTEVLDVKVDQRDPNYIYAATAWGFWRSTDRGDTWENPEGYYHNRFIYQLDLTYRRDSFRVLEIMTDSARQLPCLATTGSLLHMSHRMFRHYSDSLFLKSFLSCTPLDNKPVWYDAYDFTFITVEERLWRRAFTNQDGLWVDTAKRRVGRRYVERYKRIPDPAEHPIHALAAINRGRILLAGTFGDGLYKWDGKEWQFAGLPGSQIWRIIVKNYTVPEEVGHVH